MAQSPVAPWPTLEESYERARSTYRYSEKGPLITAQGLRELLGYSERRMYSNAYVTELLTCVFGESADSAVEDFMAKGFTWQVREDGGPSCLVRADGVVSLAFAPVVPDLLANMIMSNIGTSGDSEVPAAMWSASRWYYETMVLWAGLVTVRSRHSGGLGTSVMKASLAHGRHFDALDRAAVGPIAFADLRTAVDLTTTSELDRMTRPGAWLSEDGVFGVFTAHIEDFAQIGLRASEDPFFAALLEATKSSQPEVPSNVVPMPTRHS